jgi:hypothetical protein
LRVASTRRTSQFHSNVLDLGYWRQDCLYARASPAIRQRVKRIVGQQKTKFRGRARVRPHLRGCGLQFGDFAAEAFSRKRHDRAGKLIMTARWPLADRRGRHLGSRSSRPGASQRSPITQNGRVELAFGSLQASPDIEYSRFFNRLYCKNRRRLATLCRAARRPLIIEFAYHKGDEAVLKAKKDTSSTAC